MVAKEHPGGGDQVNLQGAEVTRLFWTLYNILLNTITFNSINNLLTG